MARLHRVRTLLPGPLKAALQALHRAARRLPLSLGPRFVTCSVRGLRIQVCVSTEIEQYRVATYGTKEPETLDWLDNELTDDDILYDIGANIGLYALYAAARNPRCRVVAFEPQAQNFSHLCWNIYVNGFENIVSCNTPLSDKEEFAYLHVSELGAGSAFHSLHAPSPLRLGGAKSVFRQATLASSVDHLVAKLGLAPPTLIKLDVDGHEAAILKGTQKTLEGGMIRSVLVEVNGAVEENPGVCTMLKHYGFTLTYTGNPVVTGSGEVARICIFRRP